MLFRVQFEKSIMIGFCSGTLMPASLYGEKDFETMYGDRVTSVSTKEVHTYGVHVCDDLRHSDGRIHHI